MLAPLCLFWAMWKERNMITFDNEELSIYRMKNSFVCSFWSWTKLYIDEGPLPLIDFFDWLGFRWGWVRFFVSPLLFCFFLLALVVYFLYALGWPLGALYSSFIKFTCAFTYIKKKNLFNCQYLDRFANLLMVKVADFSYNFIILI